MTAVQTMWIIDPFSDCSAECSPEGQRTRTVTCSSTVGGVAETVPDQDCLDAGQPRPATNQSCGVDCPYRWERRNYGDCSTSTTCGDGTQTRTVTCVRDIPSRGAVAQSDDACSSVGDKPRTERPCETICTLLPGPWSVCSVTCGGGTRRRNVTCAQMNSGLLVDLRFCPSTRPTFSTSEQCNTDSCFKYVLKIALYCLHRVILDGWQRLTAIVLPFVAVEDSSERSNVFAFKTTKSFPSTNAIRTLGRATASPVESHANTIRCRGPTVQPRATSERKRANYGAGRPTEVMLLYPNVRTREFDRYRRRLEIATPAFLATAALLGQFRCGAYAIRFAPTAGRLVPLNAS